MTVKAGRLPAARTGQVTRSYCPVCQSRFAGPAAARLGFCDSCREFTGMCAAGRKIACPDLTTRTSWHVPCTAPGEVVWQVRAGGARRIVMFCEFHDTQVRGGATPWLGEAAQVADDAPGWLRRRLRPRIGGASRAGR